MAVIDQVSQFLPCQSVYRNKGFLEVCAVYENLDFYCFPTGFRVIGDDDRARV